jgi:sortase A
MVAVITVLAIAIFVWTALRALFYAPDSEARVPTWAMIAIAPDSSKPVRLQIPSLHIDANVQNVGLNAMGNVQAPDNFTDVGWYKYGTVPGYLGSAVIDGHVDNGLALSGVFKHLEDIKVGDQVYIITQGGSKLHFVVTDIVQYPYTNAPINLIFGQNDTPRLNLITCTGTWVAGKDTYSERLVVFTKLSPSSRLSE